MSMDMFEEREEQPTEAQRHQAPLATRMRPNDLSMVQDEPQVRRWHGSFLGGDSP